MIRKKITCGKPWTDVSVEEECSMYDYYIGRGKVHKTAVCGLVLYGIEKFGRNRYLFWRLMQNFMRQFVNGCVM
jgi:hypothetical protein